MTRPQQADPALRPRLSSDGSGGWVLSGLGNPTRRFTDLGTALDTARQGLSTYDATIEVWQGSEYICCLPPEEHPHRASAAPFGGAVPQGRVMTRGERYANRIAEVLLVAAGPLFWAALVFLVLAASLGWRLALI